MSDRAFKGHGKERGGRERGGGERRGKESLQGASLRDAPLMMSGVADDDVLEGIRGQ